MRLLGPYQLQILVDKLNAPLGLHLLGKHIFEQLLQQLCAGLIGSISLSIGLKVATL